jgi:hypothetical protein
MQLPDNATGVLLRDGSYRDLSDTDPVVPRIAPVDPAAVTYTEPAYGGATRDWTTPASVRRDANDVPWLIAGLGQWSPRGQTQRLFDELSFEIITSTTPDDAVPPKIGEVTSSRQRNGTVAVLLESRSEVAKAEVVLFENGQIQVVPMTQNDQRWEATFNAQAGSQFLVQAVSPSGGVVFDTNRDLLYTIYAGTPPTPDIHIKPISGSWNYPGAFEVINRGSESVDIDWILDCWYFGHSRGLCSDQRGAVSLEPGESFTRGLGMVCSKWQFDLQWPGRDAWGAIAEIPASCSGPRFIKLPPLSVYQR